MNLLEKAIEIAQEAHFEQYDKGNNPYILHPYRVACSLDTNDEKIVGILHDVVEDSNITYDNLKEQGFPEYIIEAVASVTRKKNETYMNFIKRCKQNPIGRKVKLADLSDNMNIKRISNPTQKDYDRIKKYKKATEELLRGDFLMNLQEIIQENKEYNKLKEECNKKYANLKTINNNINLEDVKKLSYEEIKNLYEMIKYRIDDKNIEDKLQIIYKEASEKKYPILKKAYHYPILNDIKFLTDKQKNQLDSVLVAFYGRKIMTGCHAWIDLNFTTEQTQKVLDFLYSKGFTTKTYHIHCTCGDSDCFGEDITEEQYNKFIAYHSITFKEQGEMTNDEYEDYQERWEKEGYFNSGCWNDGEVEVCSIEDLKKYAKLSYYILNAKPDCTYDNILL